MRSRHATLFTLCVIGFLLAAMNLFVAAKRSTIPSQLHAKVLAKHTRTEKHPGHDDVHLLDLDGLGRIHVDPLVFDAVAEGDQLDKQAWSRTLQCNGREIALEWSADFNGLTRVMPASLLAMLVITLVVRRPRKTTRLPESDGE